MGLRIRIALLALALVAAGPAGEFRGGVLDPPRPAPDFTLRTPEGREFRLGAQRGRVVALTFGYSLCPDICPTTLAELARARAALGDRARGVQVAFVTVDPERDSPERLRAFTAVFDRTFVGLTGTPEQLERVRQAYGVTARKRVVAGTSAVVIDHSALVYLIDPEGRLRVMFPFGASADDIAHDIGLLLGR